MAQENQTAMVNMSEDREEQSRVEQVPSSTTGAISEYHSVARSSGISRREPTVTTTSSSSVFQSQRIQSMIDNRRNFSSEAEFDMEYSRDHWSELTDSDTDSSSTRLSNREHFEALKNHPEWGGFFKDVKVVLGEKINEGAQAEIYDAKVEFEDGRKSPDYGYHVVKVMKGDCPLQAFQRQWPVGMLCNASKDRVKGPLMWIQCGTMIDNRFAFVMVRQWGDLRKLIDLKMQLHNNLVPPFGFNFKFVTNMMLCIARDMQALHDKYGIIHRDLKASNVLLWSFSEELPDGNPHVKANVVDYECSVGVVGTGYWRAPEILQQLKDRVHWSKLKFSRKSDVYSYGMLCYELLTGRIPFEDHESARDYDLILKGIRPEISQVCMPGFRPEISAMNITGLLIESIIELCWKHEPLERPTFSEIVSLLELAGDRSIPEESKLRMIRSCVNFRESDEQYLYFSLQETWKKTVPGRLVRWRTAASKIGLLTTLESMELT